MRFYLFIICLLIPTFVLGLSIGKQSIECPLYYFALSDDELIFITPEKKLKTIIDQNEHDVIYKVLERMK